VLENKRYHYPSEMELTVVLLSHLIDALESLSLDEEKQVLLWSGATEVMDSYVETICRLFDDSGFSKAVENNQAVAFLGKELTDVWLEIDEVSDNIDPYTSVTEIASSRSMQKLRQLAGIALPLVKARTKGLIYKDGLYWQSKLISD
jgi:hypothetical protein